MTLLAAKSDFILPSFAIVWLLVSVLVVFVASFFQAVCLMLAFAATRVPWVGYASALGTVVMCNVIFYGFSSIMALGYWIGFTDGRGGLEILFSPINFVFLFTATVLGHAAIFAQRFSDTGGLPIGYGRACALSVIYLGLCSFVYSFLGFLVLVILTTTKT
jgi:hypothetical protein